MLLNVNGEIIVEGPLTQWNTSHRINSKKHIPITNASLVFLLQLLRQFQFQYEEVNVLITRMALSFLLPSSVSVMELYFHFMVSNKNARKSTSCSTFGGLLELKCYFMNKSICGILRIKPCCTEKKS